MVLRNFGRGRPLNAPAAVRENGAVGQCQVLRFLILSKKNPTTQTASDNIASGTGD